MKDYPKSIEQTPGIWMELDETRVLLSLRHLKTPEAFFTALKAAGFSIDTESVHPSPRGKVLINNNLTRYFLRSQNGGPISDEQLERLRGTLENNFEWFAPLYKHPQSEGLGGLFALLPTMLLVKVEKSGENAIVKLAKTLGLVLNQERTKYLAGYLCLENPDGAQDIFALRDRLLSSAGKNLEMEAHFDYMPYLSPLAFVPSDVFYPQQWNLHRIQAQDAWDIGTGAAAVSVAVIDTGCDMGHPDIQYNGTGFNAGSLAMDGSPAWSDRNHGTACAGIVAGTFNNAIGVAGVAGNCRIISIALQMGTVAELATAVNFATMNGAQVISMSLGFTGFYGSDPLIDAALANAFTSGLVICVATGNENGPITYPALNANVMAIGGSDFSDNRKNPASPDGENWWGSNFGARQSVVAPCVNIPTTDRRGNGMDGAGFNLGYNFNAGAGRVSGPVFWPDTGDVAGDYFNHFNGTSSATPEVAGMAALLRSAYPALTNIQVQEIIEKTAEKVGTAAYANTPGRPNGTWNAQMGYGRINLFRALNHADIFIRDYPGDDGTEPSTPPGGDFWDFSDIVVRAIDDNVFNPADPAQSSQVERGQDNFIYIQVTNEGAREALNVIVNCRITPYVGVQFVLNDWNLVDATHIQPTSIVNTFASIPAGASRVAKFQLSATDVETMYGWQTTMPWHPCMLAVALSDNDYSFNPTIATGYGITNWNNLAQRNLSVINLVGMTPGAMRAVAFPFLAGNRFDKDTEMRITVDKSLMGKAERVLLSLDDDGSAFPALELGGPVPGGKPNTGEGLVFLEKTKVETTFGCCRGILTLEKGSRFDCAPGRPMTKVLGIEGGELILRGDKRYVEIRDPKAVVRLEKQANQVYPMSVHFEILANVAEGERYRLVVSQQNQVGETVGGATAIYNVK